MQKHYPNKPIWIWWWGTENKCSQWIQAILAHLGSKGRKGHLYIPRSTMQSNSFKLPSNLAFSSILPIAKSAQLHAFFGRIAVPCFCTKFCSEKWQLLTRTQISTALSYAIGGEKFKRSITTLKAQLLLIFILKPKSSSYISVRKRSKTGAFMARESGTTPAWLRRPDCVSTRPVCSALFSMAVRHGLPKWSRRRN